MFYCNVEFTIQYVEVGWFFGFLVGWLVGWLFSSFVRSIARSFDRSFVYLWTHISDNICTHLADILHVIIRSSKWYSRSCILAVRCCCTQFQDQYALYNTTTSLDVRTVSCFTNSRRFNLTQAHAVRPLSSSLLYLSD